MTHQNRQRSLRPIQDTLLADQTETSLIGAKNNDVKHGHRVLTSGGSTLRDVCDALLNGHNKQLAFALGQGNKRRDGYGVQVLEPMVSLV